MTKRRALEWDFEYLLDLNLFTTGFDNGFWVTMRVRSIPPDEARPHGLQYALSLYDGSDDRVLGYDNAHPVDEASGPARKSRRQKTADHIDERGKRPRKYNFTTTAQLLADFWSDVERILDEDEGQRR